MTIVRVLGFVLALLAGETAAAHHSPAAFDRATEVRIEGTLTKFAYNNPHIYLTVDVIDADEHAADTRDAKRARSP